MIEVVAADPRRDRRRRAGPARGDQPDRPASVTDVREQVAALVYPGFVTATGRSRLPDLIRYLQAARHRLEVLPEHPRRDADRMGRVHAVRDEYADELTAWPTDARCHRPWPRSGG